MTNELEGGESDDSIMCEGRGAQDSRQSTSKQARDKLCLWGEGALAPHPNPIYVFDCRHISVIL